jgi:hypothetical protein
LIERKGPGYGISGFQQKLLVRGQRFRDSGNPKFHKYGNHHRTANQARHAPDCNPKAFNGA